jgi:acetylornithine deacetylase/succinyl-diaminopimelate desuccinylase-like protein
MDDVARAELAEFIAIPSISADPAHREDVKRAGEWAAEFIRSKCGGTAELTPWGDKELVLGEVRASTDPENAPTVLVYNHFDVQPPEPLDLWESDPFELTVKDEWAYARGITDDKGQLFIMLKAAQRLVEAGALPVNLRFAYDGEEEIGGTTIVDWISQDERGADTGLIFDGGMVRVDVPAFGLGTRGLVGFDVKVTTGERDLHSGMYGGVALNAVHVLMACLSSVLAGDNGLLPDVLRQGIVAPTPEELASWEALPNGADELALAGARPLDADAAAQFNIRTLAEPSADVVGIIGGKPGVRNTTLSVHAAGEVTIRLAPGQQVDVIGAAAEKLMRDAASAGADVEIVWKGVPAGLMRPDAAPIKLCADAFEQVLGVRPLLVRSGGTLPIVPALADKGIQTVITGFGTPESSVHSPNERMLYRYFEQGIDVAAAVYTELGKL